MRNYKNFEEAAVKMFPNLKTAKEITRKEVEAVIKVNKYEVKYPYYIVNSENSVRRGVFKFTPPVQQPTPQIERRNGEVNLQQNATQEPIQRPDYNRVVPESLLPRHVEPEIVQELHIVQEPIVEQNLPEVVTEQSSDVQESIVESDQEMDLRIQKTYESLQILVNAIAKGVTPSLIISGHAGIGKSHTVREELDTAGVDYTIAKGYTKATGVYKLLYENRLPGQVIVFDDIDEVFDDATALNILKGALELHKSKTLSWLSERKFKDEEGLDMPRQFRYEGSVIFLTNLDFDELIKKGSKISVHLKALNSRSMVFNLNINTPREIFTRIKQVVYNSNLCVANDISDHMRDDILAYLELYLDQLKDVSIRSFEKLASLIKTDPLFWETLADRMLLK